MKIDVIGRIKNVNLPFSKSLFPLFEAVVNSINTIEEVDNRNGEISIMIERDKSQEILDNSDYEQYPIKSFKIADNGIGFDENNYNAFLTADTTYKAEKGAKGVGRFVWLKAFKKVSIESNYSQDSKYYKRKFNFVLSENGIEKHELNETDNANNLTIVNLIGFKEKYQTSCPKATNAICKRLIEHTLVYFLNDNCPNIYFVDNNKKFDLKKIFDEHFKTFSKDETVEIKSKQFTLTHLRLYGSEENNHLIHYCANNREVKHENLSRFIPDLYKKIKDEDEKPFVYASYVSGKYLDIKVNAERTDFNFPENGSSLFPDEISKEELTKGIISSSRELLNPYLQKIKEEKTKRIETFVRTKAPHYRATLKYKSEFIDNIPAGLPDDKLELELHKATQSIELRLKEKSKEILKTDISTVSDIDEYKSKYKQFIEEFNDLGKSQLAQYIVHRKLILELLSKNLQKDQTIDKYSLEESVHEIIFPLRKTSDEIGYERQNLWIIDEKLAYHKYLASDIALNKIDLITTDDAHRPDIIIFNEPFAFVEDTQPYSSVVILEFKRPMRQEYTLDDNNPISQIYKYVEQIKSGKKQDYQGRPITVTDNTPFYAYIICDLTPKMEEIVKYLDLTKAPDNLGYFGYNKELKTYVEVISYDKLLNDSQKRNQVLFDKLKLPN